MTDTVHVVVLGGGYAGVMAANRLGRRPDIRVTLVNPRPEFVERIRLHQLAAGNDDATESYQTLLRDGVELLVDGADRIDASARQVHLSSGATLPYDYLVYAVGSTGTVPAGVPGAVDFAYPLSELEQAHRLRERLADVAMSADVVVVGGGLTGIEAATEFAEAGRRVTLVSDVLAPTLSAGGRRSVEKRLRALGVGLHVGAAVTEVTADRVLLRDGRELSSAVTVWTAGFGVPSLAAASGMATDGQGRLLTDETLTSVDHPRVVAAGDAASPSGLPLRMSCQAALPLGAQAADTVLARIDARGPAGIDVAMNAQCISLGRRAGVLQINHSDDTPRRLFIGGRAGAFLKEQVCRYTLRYLRGEAAEPGSYTWSKGPDRRAQLPDADTAEAPAR